MKKHVVILLACMILGACGVKPGNVEPPEGAGTAFPRTYPDTATDPGATP